jgi:hypothetical protein
MRLYTLFIIIILIPVTVLAETPGVSRDELEQLTDWMTGSFSSAEQAAQDTDYVDVRLQMIRIWKTRTGGYWLYVEQAVAWSLDKPYRQRVYHVTQLTDDLFLSRVFTVDEPLRFAGAWQSKEPLTPLTPDSLHLKRGCGIVLRKTKEGNFMGSTVGKECKTMLHGAHYATAEVLIKETMIITWDRGFDENGQHIWGAEKGGYVLKKLENYLVD